MNTDCQRCLFAKILLDPPSEEGFATFVRITIRAIWRALLTEPVIQLPAAVL
jgi:hypothetical protein